MTGFLPKEKLTAYQRWEVAAFDEAAIRAHLERHGVAPGDVGARYGAEGMGPSMYLKDPDGNTVELKGPPA